jgi:hypothetical protein
LLDDLQRPAEGSTSPIQLDFRLARLGPLALFLSVIASP